MDYSQPQSLAYFKEVARYWVEQYGIDGWRLDQAYQLGLDDWRAIRSEVERASAARKAAGQQWGTLGYMVGEVEGRRRDPRPSVWAERQPGTLLGVRLPAALRPGAGAGGGGVRQGWAGGQRARRQLEQGGELPEPRHAQPDAGQPRSGAFRRSAGARQLQSGGLLAAPQGGLQLPGGPLRPHHPYYGEEFGDEVPGFAKQVGGDCAAQGLCDDHVARSDGRCRVPPALCRAASRAS